MNILDYSPLNWYVEVGDIMEDEFCKLFISGLSYPRDE